MHEDVENKLFAANPELLKAVDDWSATQGSHLKDMQTSLSTSLLQSVDALELDTDAKLEILDQLADDKRAVERLLEDEKHKRSEEHTSELQSLMRISYAVYCLKQNNKKHKAIHLNSQT